MQQTIIFHTLWSGTKYKFCTYVLKFNHSKKRQIQRWYKRWEWKDIPNGLSKITIHGRCAEYLVWSKLGCFASNWTDAVSFWLYTCSQKKEKQYKTSQAQFPSYLLYLTLKLPPVHNSVQKCRSKDVLGTVWLVLFFVVVFFFKKGIIPS